MSLIHPLGSPSASAGLTGEALIAPDGKVWLPYDLQQMGRSSYVPQSGWSAWSTWRTAAVPGALDPARATLYLVNGMGVSLGDAVVGLGVLAWIRAQRPDLHIHLYRTPNASLAVEALHQLAMDTGGIFDGKSYLPVELDAMPADAIDLGDYAYRAEFGEMPMVDFFLRAMRIAPSAMPFEQRCNAWLERLVTPPLPARMPRRYTLFCSRASTPLRSVPADAQTLMVDRLWSHYGLPVLGFGPVDHPHYTNVARHSTTLLQFLSWVRSAEVVLTVDSAALHVAAGFGRPTLVVFNSIAPDLRMRDYPRCRAVDLRVPESSGLHASDDVRVLRAVQQRWRAWLATRDWPWPDIELGTVSIENLC